jgi:hypothetical protein
VVQLKLCHPRRDTEDCQHPFQLRFRLRVTVALVLRDARALPLPVAFAWSSFNVFAHLNIGRSPSTLLPGQERWNKRDPSDKRVLICEPPVSPFRQDDDATKVRRAAP